MVIQNFLKDRKGLLLISISSVLLGIWATVGTIALRNILLVIGGCISIAYWMECIRILVNHPTRNHSFHGQVFNWIPICLVVLMLGWVVSHYFFFARYPEQQWDELTSTWARASLATLMGSALGLALQRNKKWAWLLWLGLLISFLVLLVQYIPKAIERDSLFATDFFGNYIYWAKFNGVLAGTLLISGLAGFAIDQWRYQRQNQSPIEVSFEKKKNQALWTYVVFGIFIPTYSFVFIFSSKNGVAMAVFILIFSIFFGVIQFRLNRKRRFVVGSKNGSIIKKFLLFLVLLFSLTWLVAHHIKNSPGWESMIEDIAISSKIDEYPNWLNIAADGYPHRKDGSFVAGNTYERVAWGLAGLRLIADNPNGVGIANAFPVLVEEKFNEKIDAAYTHSAWVDLGLSYGWPALMFVPLALFSCVLLGAFQTNQSFQATIVLISGALLLLYLVGEYGYQHGIEILFFCCSLTAGLVLANNIDE